MPEPRPRPAFVSVGVTEPVLVRSWMEAKKAIGDEADSLRHMFVYSPSVVAGGVWLVPHPDVQPHAFRRPPS